MPELSLELHIPAGQVLRYYRGQAHAVQARATTGQMVQFPVSALQRHITADGVHGHFRIEFSTEYKFITLERIS